MQLFKHIALAGLAIGTLGVSNTASASRIWSTIGGACVPVDEDVQVDNYDSRGFGVGFKGVATGDIRLLCGITPSTATFRKFTMSYKDPDGMTTGSRIRATLRQVADGSNASSAICTADSDTSTVTGNNILTCDFADFTPSATTSYFFEVLIERTSSTLDPEFLALALFDNA